MDTAQDRSPWLSVVDAAKLLGVAPATVKRRLRDGKPVRISPEHSVEIEAERVSRPQGHEWQVRIKTALPPIRTVQDEDDSEESAPINDAQEPSGAISALRDILEADRATIRAQAETIAELNLRLGRAEALAEQADRERARADELAERLAEAEARLRRPWWRRMWG